MESGPSAVAALAKLWLAVSVSGCWPFPHFLLLFFLLGAFFALLAADVACWEDGVGTGVGAGVLSWIAGGEPWAARMSASMSIFGTIFAAELDKELLIRCR